MLDYDLLKRLCTCCGISGDEGQVRSLIINEIRPFADELSVDNLGNILVLKKGRKRPGKKLLISAHMDEVGFIVTHITGDGLLKFDCVGGINDSAAFSKNVFVGKDKVPGVVCAKPLHLLKADEKKKNPPIKDLLIDLGAESLDEAAMYVSCGDSIVFDTMYENKDGRVISKAIDDRFGCLVLIELIKSELEYDTWFSFVVQEEVGLRGAKCAAFTVAPDCALVIEATTAADVPYSEEENCVCHVGGGAVVTFMDRSTIYDREYYFTAWEMARELGIKVQTKTRIAGGNDAGAIHSSRGGVRTLALSVPCRYLHAGASLASTEDMEAVYALAKAVAGKIQTL